MELVNRKFVARKIGRSHTICRNICSRIIKMLVTPAEEENTSEVRREDQDNINKFARLNARLNELRDERKVIEVR